MYIPSPFITLYVFSVYKNYIDLSKVGAWGNSLQTNKEYKTNKNCRINYHKKDLANDIFAEDLWQSVLKNLWHRVNDKP